MSISRFAPPADVWAGGYNELAGTLFKTPTSPKCSSRPLQGDVDVRLMMMQPDMTDADRALISSTAAARAERIVITHGTTRWKSPRHSARASARPSS